MAVCPRRGPTSSFWSIYFIVQSEESKALICLLHLLKSTLKLHEVYYRKYKPKTVNTLMFTDKSGVWKLISLDFSLLGFIGARFEKLVELKSNYPTLFLKVDDNLNVQKMSLCCCFCFTDIFDFIMFPQSYQPLQPGLITFMRSRDLFSPLSSWSSLFWS